MFNRKKGFDIDDPGTIYNFPKILHKKNICLGPQNISSLLDITRPLHFLNSFRTTASAELLNFQDPIQKSDFDTYQIKRQCVSLPEKVVGQP